MAVDVDAMSVSQLRAYLREAGADTSSCFEKVRPDPIGAGPCPRGREGSLPPSPRVPRPPPISAFAPFRTSRSDRGETPDLPSRHPSRASQSDLVRLAKKVQRSGASRGAGSSGAGQRASSGAGASSSGAGGARPEPQGRPDTSTPKQRELVARVNRAKDYYDIFECDKSASEADLKKAYRKLALQLHPDKNTAPGAEEAFKKVNKAWDVLSDKSKRSTYDMFGADAAEGRPGGGGGNPFGAGGNPFGAGFGPGMGGMGGMGGIPIEEILRQFQAQGGFGGMGGGAGGVPSFDFNLGSVVKGLLSNPAMLIYGLPLIMMGFNILSSLFSLVANYWYVLLILPMVPAPQRKQVMMMMFLYSMFGRGMYFL